MAPLAGATQTTDYSYPPGANRLTYSITQDPPVSASFEDYVLTLVYPKHHLPQGQPLQEQYWDLLDELERLLDRADAGKKNVSLAPFLAHLRAFLNHAQLNKGETIRKLLIDNGVPSGLASWVEEEKWWNSRQEDLALWTQDQRDDLRIWLDWASIIQIVALEADPVLNERWYSYDAAGSLAGETVAIAGADPTYTDYANTDNFHLDSVILPSGSAEDYAYDHLNRRVVKQSPTQTTVYHYDLFGNLIGESRPDGTMIREWVYLNGQRLAMILPAPGGGGGGGCEAPELPEFRSCSVLPASQSSGTDAVLLMLGPAFIVIGLKYHRRKYTILGLTFIGGMLFFLLMPQAQSQTPAEQIYYYHNDHLGTPRVLTDQTGAVVWDVDYTPFGEISSYVTNTLPVDQPFRFPGQYNDQMTGLYYNWNRYYMPEIGRYNRVDPIYLDNPLIIESRIIC